MTDYKFKVTIYVTSTNPGETAVLDGRACAYEARELRKTVHAFGRGLRGVLGDCHDRWPKSFLDPYPKEDA